MGLAAADPDGKAISIDTTHLRALQACGWKAERGRLIRQAKCGVNTNLHAGTDTSSRPTRFFISAGQGRDSTLYRRCGIAQQSTGYGMAPGSLDRLDRHGIKDPLPRA